MLPTSHKESGRGKDRMTTSVRLQLRTLQGARRKVISLLASIQLHPFLRQYALLVLCTSIRRILGHRFVEESAESCEIDSALFQAISSL